MREGVVISKARNRTNELRNVSLRYSYDSWGIVGLIGDHPHLGGICLCRSATFGKIL